MTSSGTTVLGHAGDMITYPRQQLHITPLFQKVAVMQQEMQHCTNKRMEEDCKLQNMEIKTAHFKLLRKKQFCKCVSRSAFNNFVRPQGYAPCVLVFGVTFVCSQEISTVNLKGSREREQKLCLNARQQRCG